MIARVPRALAASPVRTGAIALFVGLSLAYAWSVDLRATRGAAITGDEPFYLMTTASLLEDGDIDLRQQYERESWRAFFDHPDGLWRQSVPLEDGRLLSPHEPGLSLLVLPGYALGGLRGVQVQLLLIAALTWSLAFVLAARLIGDGRASWLATAGVALSPTSFVYATEVYPEVPAALCLVVALLPMTRANHGRSASHAVAIGAALVALAWLGMKYVPLGALVAAWFLARSSFRARAWFLAVTGGSAAVYVWFHLDVYGSLTAYSSNTVFEGAPTIEVLRGHLALESRVYRLWGLFIDERFGVGRWGPLLLGVLPSLTLLARLGRLGRLAAALVATQLLIATFVAITMMGWWFPGRTLVVVLPLASIGLALLARRASSAGRAVLASLGVLTIASTVALVASARASEVTLAVDPFTMRVGWFQSLARVFPNYTRWTEETVALTVAWLVAGLLVVVALEGRALRTALGRWPARVAAGRARARAADS